MADRSLLVCRMRAARQAAGLGFCHGYGALHLARVSDPDVAVLAVNDTSRAMRNT